MLGVKGGFFVINLNRFNQKSEDALRASALLSYVDGKRCESEEKNKEKADFIPVIQNHSKATESQSLVIPKPVKKR